jgi:FkbM family methyltransferase
MTPFRLSPGLLRHLPIRLRQSVWARCYRPTAVQDEHLFERSQLHFAPDMRMRLIPHDCISDAIAFTGVYEAPLSRWIVRAACEGGLMIDVGANLGYFTLLWAAQNPANRVLAFEASPRNVSLLHDNIQRNHVHDRVDLRAEAVGKAAGTCQFDVGPADQTGWGGLVAQASEASIEVNVVRLDDVVAPQEDVSVLKVDVEGADAWVLQGAERLLRERRIRHVWWEQHKPRMRQLGIAEREPEEFMRSVGYLPVARSVPSAESVPWYAAPAS